MRAYAPQDWQPRLFHAVAGALARPVRVLAIEPKPAQVPAAKSTFVPVPDGALHTLEWGAGAAGVPVVLVHGLCSNARYFAGAASMLRGRRVLAPDLRGHGKTGALPGGYRLEKTRADLLAWMDALGLRQVDLTGHSWGGRVVLDFAQAAPERVRRLALVDPAPPEGLHAVLRAATPLMGAAYSGERGPYRSAAEVAAARERLSWMAGAPPWLCEAFEAGLKAGPDGALRHVLCDADLDAITERLMEAGPATLDRVTMPVLVVRATFSVLLGGQLARLRRALPQARVVHVPGEHALHAGNPAGLGRALAEFFAG